MKVKILTCLFILTSAFVSAQVKRGADGRRNLLSGPDSLLASKMCGKNWVWIEGMEDKSKMGSFVFSLNYKPDGTVSYNQRKENGFWKVVGNYIYHAVDSNLIDKAPHHFGVFEGALKVEQVSDSILILKRVSKKNKKVPEYFTLYKDWRQPGLGFQNERDRVAAKAIQVDKTLRPSFIKKGELFKSKYVYRVKWSEQLKTSIDKNTGFVELRATETEQGKTVRKQFKKVYSANKNLRFYRNDTLIPQAAYEKETEYFELISEEPIIVLSIQTYSFGEYKSVYYKDSRVDYYLDGVKLDGPITIQK
jgi:hypothetical protein